MPFVAILGGVIAQVLRFFIVKFLVSLGFGIAVFTGYVYVINKIEDHVREAYNGLPLVAVQLFNLVGLDVGIGLIFTAFHFRVALKVANKVFVGGSQ